MERKRRIEIVVIGWFLFTIGSVLSIFKTLAYLALLVTFDQMSWAKFRELYLRAPHLFLKVYLVTSELLSGLAVWYAWAIGGILLLKFLESGRRFILLACLINIPINLSYFFIKPKNELLFFLIPLLYSVSIIYYFTRPKVKLIFKRVRGQVSNI